MKWKYTLILMAPVVVLADPPTWLTKDNPNELYPAGIVGDGCDAITPSQLKSLVSDVFRQQGIEVASQGGLDELQLLVELHCARNNEFSWIAHVSVDFVKVHNVEGEILLSLRANHRNYAAGIVTESDLKAGIAEFVLDAIDEYRRVNSSLSPNN